jgi:hypothetical protein
VAPYLFHSGLKILLKLNRSTNHDMHRALEGQGSPEKQQKIINCKYVFV